MTNERIGNVTLTDTPGSPFYVRYRRRGRQVTRSLRTRDIVHPLFRLSLYTFRVYCRIIP
jgi:hypothetical protein